MSCRDILKEILGLNLFGVIFTKKVIDKTESDQETCQVISGPIFNEEVNPKSAKSFKPPRVTLCA